MLKRLELEWKILIAAAILIIFVTVPMRTLFEKQLDIAVQESIDEDLKPYLEKRLHQLKSIDTSDSLALAERESVKRLLARHLQWQSMMNLSLERQKRGFRNVSYLLIVFAVITAFFIFYRLTLPLKKLAQEVKKIGEGGRASIEIHSSGAMRILEQNLNDMQEELVKLRREAELQGMESAWRDIARIMAHEIKNPLTPMRLLVDRLEEASVLEKTISPELVTTSVERMNRQLDTLEELVNRYRSFSTEQKVNCQQIELVPLLQEYQTDFSETLHTEIHGTGKALIDKALFRQIVLNILKNAINAGSTQMKIAIESDRHTTFITYSDNGNGISKEKIDTLFLPYTSYSEGGSGIGLSVVKKLIESMHGTVTIESDEGAGFTLSMSLPSGSEDIV